MYNEGVWIDELVFRYLLFNQTEMAKRILMIFVGLLVYRLARHHFS